MIRWLLSFALTQAIEIPIYRRGLAHLHGRSKLAVAFAASAITHPFVFLVFPGALPGGWLTHILVAETFAVVVEALWLRLFGVKNALLWSIVANASSVAAGATIRVLLASW